MAQTEAIFSSVKITCLATEIKYKNRNDFVIVELPKGATTAGVFTKNAFAAAPVLLAKKHLAQKATGALVINAGNANAATGAQGLKDANSICEMTAELLQLEKQQILPFSTGVIGENLPMHKIELALTNLHASATQVLANSTFADFSRAIMTTDTKPKLVEYQAQIKGEKVSFIGVTKGAGMISPNMATTLTFVFTDAKIEQADLQNYLQSAIEPTLNSISIDADTSTNDSCTLTALGEGAHIGANNKEFQTALTETLKRLALMLVEDGEGATKLIHILVKGAKTPAEAKATGFSIANSPLVKTAFFASDPNWGRLIMAIGKTPELEDLDISKVNVFLEDFQLVEKGGKSASYDEKTAAKIMQAQEINVKVELGRGVANWQVHSCDLSYDYVKINAEYRS